MLPLLIRFLNRFRPREGWAPLLLVLTALICPPAALIQTNEDVDAVALLILTVLAMLAGLALARSRLPARGAIVLSGMAGACLVTVIAGRLLPPLSLLWTEITYATDWFASWQQGMVNHPLPLASTAGFLWQRLSVLGIRLWWWGKGVASGGPAQDPIAFLLLACFLAWAFACFATWQIYRRRSALVGLLPSGVAVATISFLGGGLSFFYLLVFLFCTLWLIAACDLLTRQDRWQQTETDYPGDLGLDLVFMLSPALVFLLALAAFFPAIHPHRVRDTFRELMDPAWSAVERASERLFGPIEGAGFSPWGSGGSLPRAHLLGGGPALGETVVMYVRTNDPPPPIPDSAEPEATRPPAPRRFWRSVTYDTYTGQGWRNGPLESRTSAPSRILYTSLAPGIELLQQFDLTLPGEGYLYAVNEPLRTDHEVQSWWRDPTDLAHISSRSRRYTVISRPPEPTITDLHRAPEAGPPGLIDRYLALPETIPQRVLDLAQEVVGQAEGRYDQALAIETYVRAYSYTLELPAPPADRDLVDYFLFEGQEGYCDYFASAMVVMARSIGIPARLATGYAQGTYDPNEERWIVTEQDGHTWVEVFFDGIGWVEFEPTSGQPLLDRPGGGLPRPSVPPVPSRPLPWWQRIPLVLVGMGAAGVLAVFVVVWIWRPRHRRDLAANDLVLHRYGRLLKWGERLEQPLRDGQTPAEYSAALGGRLRARGRDSRWLRVRQASVAAPGEVEGLTDAVIRAQYSSEPITDGEGWRVRDLWIRLRRRFWWLWLGHR